MENTNEININIKKILLCSINYITTNVMYGHDKSHRAVKANFTDVNGSDKLNMN